MPYWLSFTLFVLLLGGGTALFVLGVLPRRFVLQTGLRESDLSFPARLPAFGEIIREALVRPGVVRPVSRPPRPGAAELLWSRVLPLLHAGRWAEALPILRSYLARHPGDADVLREYATTLRKAGEQAEADTALRRLVRLTGSFSDRRSLARLLRDEGRTDEAAAIYDKLAEERPADAGIRLELAQALVWAGRSDAAREALAALPDSVRRGTQARTIESQIERLLAAAPESAAAGAPGAAAGKQEQAAPPLSLAERARRAAARGDLNRASFLYAEAVRRDPRDAAAWRAWADLLELRLRDYPGAATALTRWIELTGADGTQHVRLARLESWSGRQARAAAILDSLVRREPGRADAWALLGDVRRFRGDRPGASRAYRRALALEPSNEQAGQGLSALAATRERILAQREPREVGPGVSLFEDSDDYRRLDLRAAGRARSGATVIEGEAGYRVLHGRTLLGTPPQMSVRGGFADVTVGRWWREATVRTSLTAGIEHLEIEGTRPRFGAALELPDAGGFALSASLEHGPAYPTTRTLESVIEPVTASDLSLSLFRLLGDAWSLQAATDATLLASAPLDNVRLAGSAALRRAIASWLTAGYVTRWIGFTRSAHVTVGTGGATTPGPLTGPRLYWDPSSYWSHQLLLEAHTPVAGSGRPGGTSGLEARLSLQPGFAIVHERGRSAETVPQYEATGGLTGRGPWGSVSLDLFYGRTRVGGYRSWGGSLGVRVHVP